VVGVFTNTQTTTAYRGAGRPDARYAIERVIDVAAAETGIDPAELRRRNLMPAGVRHLEMPASPLRVWQALRDAGFEASAL
jgi:carbon-monoxide dehydrogenase large subunit